MANLKFIYLFGLLAVCAAEASFHLYDIPGFDQCRDISACRSNHDDAYRVLFRTGYEPLDIPIIEPLMMNYKEYNISGLEFIVRHVLYRGLSSYHNENFMIDKDAHMFRGNVSFDIEETGIYQFIWNGTSVVGRFRIYYPQLLAWYNYGYDVVMRSYEGSEEEFLMLNDWHLDGWLNRLPMSWEFDDNFLRFSKSHSFQQWLAQHFQEWKEFQDKLVGEVVHTIFEAYHNIYEIIQEHFPGRMLHHNFEDMY